MASPVGIIHNFLTFSASAGTPLPIGSSLLLNGLKIIHWGWWLSIRTETYAKEKNWVYLIGGSVLDHFIGERGLLRLAVQIYILALRTCRILDELSLLNREVSQLIDAVKGRYVPRPSARWSIKYSDDTFINHVKKQKKFEFEARVQRIVFCAKKVLNRLFSLSNRCFHAYEGFYARSHAEILVETVEALETLEENKERILELIGNQKSAINYFIDTMRLPITFEQVLSGIETGLKGAVLVPRVIDKLGEYGGHYLTTLIKTSITAIATFFNVAGKLPTKLHSNPQRQLYLQLK